MADQLLRVPRLDHDRPAQLAVYKLILNVAILSGTMLGPVLANIFGLREALLVVVTCGLSAVWPWPAGAKAVLKRGLWYNNRGPVVNTDFA